MLVVLGAVCAAVARRFLGGASSKSSTAGKGKTFSASASAKTASVSSSSSLPRNKQSSNKKNKARRAEQREKREEKLRADAEAAKKAEEKAKKGGNNVPKVRVCVRARVAYLACVRVFRGSQRRRLTGRVSFATARRIRISSVVKPGRRSPRRRT